MFSNQNEISNALVQYLGYGLNSSPVANLEKLVGLYGLDTGTALAMDIGKLIEEVNQIPIDWGNGDLELAGKAVRTEIHRRYQFLEDRALDAIVWKFTFDWR